VRRGRACVRAIWPARNASAMASSAPAAPEDLTFTGASWAAGDVSLAGGSSGVWVRGPIITEVTAGCARTKAVASCGSVSPASLATTASLASAAAFSAPAGVDASERAEGQHAHPVTLRRRAPELLDLGVRLLRLLDRPDDLRVLAPGLQREILWRLITGEQGALVRQGWPRHR
jgi:hypothetical protein